MIELVTNVKAFFNAPDEYMVKKAKECAIISVTLKIASYALLCFSYISPIYMGVSSFAMLGISLIVDYKLISNFNDLIIAMFKKSSESPYDSGYFSGRMFVNYFRIETIPYMKGFLSGVKKELFQ